MRKILIAIVWLAFILYNLLATQPVQAQQGTPPPITPSDVAALQAQANSASANLHSAQAGLAQAQAQYNAAASSAAAARAAAAQAEQQLKAQQTAQAVETATQARSIAEEADRAVTAAAQAIKLYEAQIAEAQQTIDHLSAALSSAQTELDRRASEIARRDETITAQGATIAGQGATIAVQNRQLDAERHYRELIDTLIVLLGFALIVAAIIDLIIYRWYRQSQRVVYQPAAAAVPIDASRLPADAPGHVTDQATLDHIHHIVSGSQP